MSKDVVFERQLQQLKHNFGPVVVQALDDPDVIEIMLNPDGRLWIERLGSGMAEAGTVSPAQAQIIISVVASSLNTPVSPQSPLVEGELPYWGSRFEGMASPVVAGPSFSIRKKASVVFPLESYLDNNIIDHETYTLLCEAVPARHNILVVGGTGSGKTTFVNAIINSMAIECAEDRLVIIEDTAELQSSSKNSVFLRSSAHVSMQNLVRATMRLRPDRILIGEVRGGEALDLLKAWNTGHPGGVATVHASSAEAGLLRVEQLVSEATAAPMHKVIAEAVNLIVFITRAKNEAGRAVTQVVRVNGYDSINQQYKLEYLKHEEI